MNENNKLSELRENIKLILSLSFPLCKNSDPNIAELAAKINDKAYICKKILENYNGGCGCN